MRNDAKYSSIVNKNRKQLPSQTKDTEYYDLSIKVKNQNKVIKISRNSNPTKMSFDLCKENDLDYKDLEYIKNQIENAISNLKDNSSLQNTKSKNNSNSKNYKFANLNFNNSTSKTMKDDKLIENKPQKNNNKNKNKNNLQINTNTNTISSNANYQSINSNNNKNILHDENDQVLSPINRLSKYNNTITSSNNTLSQNNNDVKYNNYFTDNNNKTNSLNNNNNKYSAVKPLNFHSINTSNNKCQINNSLNQNSNNINTINTFNVQHTRNQNSSNYQQSQKLFLCDYKIEENKTKKSNSCVKYPPSSINSNTFNTKANNSMNLNTLSSNRNNYTLLTENKNINNTLSICKSSNSVSRKKDIFTRLYKDSQIKRITYRRPCHFSKTVANRGNGNLTNINRSFREIYNNNNSINTINFLNELMSDNYNNSYMLKNNSLNKYSFQPNEYRSRKNSLSPGKNVENEEYGYHHQKRNSNYSNSINNNNYNNYNYKPVISHGQNNFNQNIMSNYCLTTVDSKNNYKPLRDRLTCTSQEENLCLKETRTVVFKNLFNELINDSNCGQLNKNTICLDFIPFEIQEELKIIIYDVVQKNKCFSFDEFCNAMNDLFNNMNFDKRRSIVNKYKFRISTGNEDKYKFNNYYNDYHTGRNKNSNYNGVNTFNNGGCNGNYQSFCSSKMNVSRGGSRGMNSKSKEKNKNPYVKRNFYYLFS